MKKEVVGGRIIQKIALEKTVSDQITEDGVKNCCVQYFI